VGIFRHPESWKITSSNSNSNYTENYKKIAEILKGSHIDDEQWTQEKIVSEKLEELVYDPPSPAMTVEKLIDTYKGIDWMRLLNGIFRDTNITIELHDLVQVQDHQYLLQLSNDFNNQTKE
jgi:hypothetical protein